MDITHVSHLYRPSIGGIENYVHRLSTSLQESGHTVEVVTTDASLSNEASPLDQDQGVRYCATTTSLFRNPVSLELYNTLAEHDADLYHLHSPYFLPTVEAVAALPDDASVVLTVHGFPPNRSLLTRLRNRLYRPVGGYVLDKVDRTIVLGNSERQRLLDQFDVPPASVRVIPNGIHPSRHDVSTEDVDAFRTAYNVDPTTPTILYVSRFVESKQPRVLVNALVEELPDVDVDVLMVGTGKKSMCRTLKRQSDDRIQLLSNLDFQTLQSAYHAADIFVHLSLSEGLSTVILEAMNARLPIISTPAGALVDVLSQGETGSVLTMPPQSEEVASAIRQYVDDPRLCTQIGRRNRKYVRMEFNWDDIARQIESIYYEVAGTGRYAPTPSRASVHRD